MSWRFVLAQLVLILLCGDSRTLSAASPPNVLLILADDMGFSDLGCYGGEIATPNLDALAAQGLRYTQFYNTARCWPTRASILSGYYAQQVGRDALPHAGNRGTRPSWARLLPDLLRPLGYRSYHSGKWHIDGNPLGTGFDHSYRYEDYDRNFTPKAHFLDDKQLPTKTLDDNYYSTTAIADYAISFLQGHQQHHPDQPFFEYLAFVVPHFPLQAPAEDIALYRTRYGQGWDALRNERWAAVQEKLLIPGELSPLEPEIGPPYDFPNAIANLGQGEVNRELSWNSLSPAQQRFQVRKMAIHAAMVDRMDREIGRVIAQLHEMGALENTLILFLSDNGASAEIMVRGDGHDPQALAGSANSFLCLGPGWSRASNTPFRRHKTWVHEGGIATPLVVHWPAGIKSHGELRHTPGHLIDLAPTIVELAGGVWPERFQGLTVPPTPGRNLANSFASDQTIERDCLWWLHEGNRALRMGDWKLVAAKGEPWELYNLAIDRPENNNLAAEKPEKVQLLQSQWNEMTNEFENSFRRKK
ncbi:arylsulfatase [Bythopirellula polymerisocia]|nr:arylsulfatase [Bythopirellula polymerisocia]